MLEIIVGGFFGDEGKGKIAAYLALKDRPSLAVRCGAVNAGHTVVFRDVNYRLRVIPSAFVNPQSKLAVAAGALIRLDVMWRELASTGVNDRFFIDLNTGVIEERHVLTEKNDPTLSGVIGSTLQGVGAAMSDRVMRRLRTAKEFPGLRKFLTNVADEVHRALHVGENVMVEGTQGTFLSLYHGTYPYVTSRDTTASGFASEVGVGPKDVDEVIVIFKAYMTRVGVGPLPGELSPLRIQELGWTEVATVTGRVRRAAPFNSDMARRAVELNSATQVAITKIDVLFPRARGVREWNRLPRNAKEWIESVEESLRVPVTLVGTGPHIEEVIDRREELGFKP